MSGLLTGTYRVRVYRPVFSEAKKMFPRVSDFMEIKRHALKLRFWPRAGPQNTHGQVLDLDWSWVEGISSRDIGELRIHDVIANQNDLRIISCVPGIVCNGSGLPTIWILRVFQKKADGFSTRDLEIFKQRGIQVRRLPP